MQLDLDAEAPPEPLDRHLDMDLREAADDELGGLRVTTVGEGRILLVQAPEAGSELVVVALRPGVDREAHHRIGVDQRRRLELVIVVEQQVAGLDVLQLADRTDVARRELVDVDVILALHHQQVAKPLPGVRADVVDRGVVDEGALDHLEHGDASGKRVGDRLEDEGGGAGAWRQQRLEEVR